MVGLQALLHLSLQLFLVSMFLQPPANLSLFSQNFQHVLTWEEPNDEPLIYYDVLFSKYLSSFLPAPNCSNITIQRCDLSKHFTDILAEYRTGVRSSTHNRTSNLSIYSHFLNPLMDTVVGPPIVNVSACDGCIELILRPPISYLWSEKEQRNIPMLSRRVFPKMDYKIDLVPSLEAPILLKTISEEHYTTQISSLLPNTNYCVSVTITNIMNYKQVPSPMKCVVTKGALEKGDTSIYFFTVFAVILAVGVLLVLCALDKAGFISRKKMLIPNVLKSFPNADYILDGNMESLPLGSLVIMETVRDNEDDGGEILRAGAQENASYIANNPALRMMEERMRNECSLMEEDLPIEDSMTCLHLQEASNQAMTSLISSFTMGHRVVGAMSDINMEILWESKENTIDFNTLSVADPEELWLGCRPDPDLSEVSGDPEELWLGCRPDPDLSEVSEDPEGTQQFRHFSDVLIMDESGVEDESDVEEMSCEEHCEEQFPSGYIKR